MQTVTARYLPALRDSHVKTVRAHHVNLITGDEFDLDVLDGSFTIDTTNAMRRQLAITLPAQQAVWDRLDTVGGEITLTKSIRYIDGASEQVPCGVYVVDQDQIGYGPGDTIQLTCPDRWVKVQRNRFAPNARNSVPGNAAWVEIKRLVEGAWPSSSYPFPGWASVDHTATTKVGSLLWDDGDREAAILALAKDNAVEVFFDATGLAVLRPVPIFTDTSVPVWRVDAGERGVLLDADRSRDRSTVRNAIILSTSATDVTFTPVEVKNTTVGDPLSVNGPLGYVPQEYSSPTLRNSAQATAAGRAMLNRGLGVAKKITLEQVCNDALDGEDVIEVLLPKTDANLDRALELHILDAVTTPLRPDGVQQLVTRSTRPSTDGS